MLAMLIIFACIVYISIGITLTVIYERYDSSSWYDENVLRVILVFSWPISFFFIGISVIINYIHEIIDRKQSKYHEAKP